MKREMKFRAWNNRLQKMTPVINLYDPIYTFDWLGLYDFPIMQYTGIVDMNGKEIYEGDVLKCIFVEGNFAIEYNNDCACYDWYILSDTKKKAASLANAIDEAPIKAKRPFNEIIEVIGNIYENPNF